MGSNICLRPANIDDIEVLFVWRNDKMSVLFSRVPKKVEFKEHKKWYKTSLVNKNRCIFIGLEDSAKVGMVRYDLDEAGKALVSIAVGKEARGRGFGTVLLREGELAILEQRPYLKTFLAEIHKGNLGSIKIFEKNGFVLKKQLDENFGLWCKILN